MEGSTAVAPLTRWQKLELNLSFIKTYSVCQSVRGSEAKLALLSCTEYIINGWYGDQSEETQYFPECNNIVTSFDHP
jgi:hypothetical protein